MSRIEQLIYKIVRASNERRVIKRCSHVFLRQFGTRWMHYCSRHLLQLRNIDVLSDINAERGVIVAANHRSYADMYLLSSVLLPRCTWIERMYFPVRSEFIYDHVAGLLLNALVAGMAMYPPVYRQSSRRALNRNAIAFLADQLKRPGTLVGMHPEGRRSKTDDPYTLLPAQPGIGEIVHRAQPIVVPAFVNGVPEDLLAGVRANFTRDRRNALITITFGRPMDFNAYGNVPAGAKASLRIAEEIRQEIQRLGAIDRQQRLQ